MKVLVYAHRLEVGGTQNNAIELAAALRDIHGFEVIIFAAPGPMVKLIEEKNLRYIAAPDAYIHPSLARIRALRAVVRSERPDLIHIWDWWQCLDAYYGVYLTMRIPMIVTDMMMNLNRILPKRLPITFGTPELVDQAKAKGWRRAELILPPVDVQMNAPDVVDPLPFRKQWGLKDSDIILVTVSRLSNWMKAESLIQSIDVVRRLGHDIPLRFVIVGEGEARDKLEQLAEETNLELGRPAILFTGALLDPRPAYAAADIVIGMGGSALRGMAFGKPVVIVGEQGFSAPLTLETAESFYYQGIYGRGNGNSDNEHLIEVIRELVEHPKQLEELGKFSRQFVVQHFSIETVSTRLADICRDAVEKVPRLYIAANDALRTAAIYLRERCFLIPSRDKNSKNQEDKL
ncbi:MAG: glycosyltransferase family 4 protein [Thiotrichaceae bacterium]